MKPRAGEVVYLILDDNRIAKRGRKMGYVSKIWDHKQQRFVRGHIPDAGRRAKRKSIARLMPGLIRHKGRHVRMKHSRGHATLRIASADGRLSRIGRVRMVVSKRPRGPWKKCIAIVTNETGLRPRQVVTTYETRWLIEVLFKELRQDLGLADYQMIAEDGIVHHLHVCCLAHLLLTHRSLEALGAKAKEGHEQVTLPPMSTRLADLRAQVARDQIERFVKGEQHAALRQKLCDYLLAA